MSTASSDMRTSRTSSTAIKYVPGPSTAEQVAEAIGCIITGRPLPAYLQPQPLAIARPATVEEGIARILAKPGLC
jgi:hypothetical protein